MQAKRFWPPTKHKLLYANIIVYGAVIILALAFGSELIWSQKTLRAYLLNSNIPPTADKELVWKATAYLSAGKDVKILQDILEQALQIEPYSEARLLLGICYLKQGDQDNMLAYYAKYRSINPSVINLYTDANRVLIEKGDLEAANQLLEEGIAHFSRRVELYKPHYNPEVQKEFNTKALNIHKKSEEALKILKKLQEQLRDLK
ncbi:MAG: hypothetical protein KAS75_00805 [Planctomycetes bacterium]|nr:hypothetical protein [Planctomycetota bacterium]